MTKAKRTWLVIVAFIAVIASALSIATVNTHATGKYDFEFSGVLEKNYKYGETVEIPTATYGGNKAEFVVNLPDGTSTNRSPLKINQTGVYSVEYLAKIPDSNEYAKKTFTFSVYNQLMSVTGSGYTEYRKLDNGVGGLYANLKKGDTLVYNGVIDLTKFSISDMLFKAGIIASTPGEADITQFEVKLADIYDENTYIVYRIKKFSDQGQYQTVVSYVDVGFGGSYCGLEQSDKGNFTYTVNGDTKNYKAHVNSEKYGRNLIFSMTGGTAAQPFDGNKLLGFTFDMNTGITYSYLCDYGGTPYYPLIISDVNNENLYGERFEGFTDGKVKISITPTKFDKGECGFFFTEIGGIGITENNWNNFETDVAPTITVDTFGYDLNDLPEVKLGSKYKIFDATAYDIFDGDVDCEVKVYYGYSNAQKVRVNIEDGYFKADRIGEYTIEYTATNALGNKSVVLAKIKCVEHAEEVSLTLVGESDYSAVNAGDKVRLFDSYEIKNNLGKAYLTVECRLNGQDIAYTLDEDNSFVPYYAGEYTISYVYGDFITVKNVEKQLTVNKADAVYYESEDSLPEYLIKNGRYDLGFVKAYSLSSGKPEEVLVKIYVANDNGKRNEVTADYTVTANENVEIYYVADTDYTVEEYVVKKTVTDIGLGVAIDKSKLFIPETTGISFVQSNESIDCLFGETAQKVGFSFANVLARHAFKLSLKPYNGGADYKTFGSFDIYLYDFENLSNKVKISFFTRDGSWYVSVNDEKTLKVANSWGDANDVLTLAYDVTGGVLQVSGNNFKIENYYGTNEKVTFDKGLIFKGEFLNVNGCKGVSLTELGNQELGAGKYDYIAPQIDVTRLDHYGEKQIGEVITVGDYFARDVISPFVTCTYSVTANGKAVVSSEGVTLTGIDGSEVYTFAIDTYGDYNFYIKATDQNGQEQAFSYKVSVVDYTPPTIVLSGIVKSGKVNTKIAFAKYEIGNDKGEHKAFITVLGPDGTMKYYGEETRFTPTKKGDYIVTISVIDKNGNLAEESYTVKVS